MAYRLLGVLDRGYRGAVEAQFFDVLYGLLDFRQQFGHADLALRGTAVTLAVEENAYLPALHLGGLELSTLPDYRQTVRDVIADGISVLVDEADLRALGFRPDQLVPGVICVNTNEVAARWPEYDGVWFV